MPVSTRRIASPHFGGVAFLGAIRTEGSVLVGCPTGQTADDLSAIFGHDLGQSLVAGRGLVAKLSADHPIAADEAEPSLLEGKNVLFAIRNGETALATLDWLTYHQGQHKADAALILDRDPLAESAFADELAALSPKLSVLVVSTEMPLGHERGTDARSSLLAPAAPRRKTPAIDPWHAPLWHVSVFEVLRHGYLSKARAVARVDIADLIVPTFENVFDRAVDVPGQVVALQGVETYPWRLRQKRPAPHSDHIARRHGDRRRLLSWAVDPTQMPADATWTPGHLRGLPLAGEAAQFRRALGVVFPGAPVNKLVNKSELREDSALVDLMSNAFKVAPLRVPASLKIPPRPATDNVTVVGVMKNEGPFILDWIAHNRSIGIEQHLIFTNDCEDGTDRLLDLLRDAGVTRRDNIFHGSGTDPQHAAYRQAKTEGMVLQADWLLTLDVDEYINIHVGQGHVTDLFAAQPDAHVFSMPWRLFGNGDVEGFDDAPVTEQFIRCAPEYAPRPWHAWAFKSVYRNAGLFRRMGVHRPKGIDRRYQAHLTWVDGSGRTMPPTVWRAAWRMGKANWGYDLVTLNHYAVRSAESFLVKRARGRANHTGRDLGDAYWFRMNHNAEEDLSIQRLGQRAAAEKAGLLALPGVAEAHEATVAWHRSKIKTLRRESDGQALFSAITSPRMKRLSRMATYFSANVYLAGPDVIPDEVVARDPKPEFFYTIDAVP